MCGGLTGSDIMSPTATAQEKHKEAIDRFWKINANENHVVQHQRTYQINFSYDCSFPNSNAQDGGGGSHPAYSTLISHSV